LFEALDFFGDFAQSFGVAIGIATALFVAGLSRSAAARLVKAASIARSETRC
jgi:hypothetical protein